MSIRRSKKLKNLEEVVESIFSQDESDENNEVFVNAKQNVAKTPSQIGKMAEVSTPRLSEAVVQDLLQTPRRSCRKSIKPAQDYEDIVKITMRSCNRSEKKFAQLDDEKENDNGDKNGQLKWSPAKVGRVSQKRGRKSKRYGKGKVPNDKESVELEQTMLLDKKEASFKCEDKLEANDITADSKEILEASCSKFENIDNLKSSGETVEIPINIQKNNQVDEITDNMECLNVKQEKDSLNSTPEENIPNNSEQSTQGDSEDDHESTEKSVQDEICIIYENNISKIELKTDSEDEMQFKSVKSNESVGKDDSFGCYLKSKEINISDLGLNPILEEDDGDEKDIQLKKSPQEIEDMPSLIICDDDDETACSKKPNLNTTFETKENEEGVVMETLQLSDDEYETPSKFSRSTVNTSLQNQLFTPPIKNEDSARPKVFYTPAKLVTELVTTPKPSIKRSARKAQLPSTPKLSTPKLLTTPQRSKTQYRLPTPYRNRNFKLIDESKENVQNSPTKVLSLTTLEPKEIVLRGIRKRSLSVCINEKQRHNLLDGIHGKPKQNRMVSFHSPANQTTLIEDLDYIIKKSLKKNKNQQNDSAKKFVTERRKRSLSLDDSVMSASFASKLPRPVLNQSVTTKSPISSSSKAIKRTKLPNFAAIHEKYFNKMENLVDHVNRKQERSKNLINSATKSIPNSSQKTLRNLPDPRSGAGKVLKSTGIPRKQLREEQERKCLKPSQATNIEKTNLNKKTTIPRKPAFNLSTSLMVRPTTSASNIVEKANTSRLNNDDKTTSRLQRHMDLFKGRAASTRPGSASSKNEVLLKGVRSNRRFELQMKHRKNLEQ